MKVSVLTLFPDLYSSFLQTSLVKRAQQKEYISIHILTLFSYVEQKERIDAPTFGPGAGMVIRPDVIEKAVEDVQKKYGQAYRIFLSPQGTRLTQPLLYNIKRNIEKNNNHCLITAARYEGIDARAQEEYADIVLSLGDFVAMGGDIPAMLFMEGIFRLIPGVVAKEESVACDSFTNAFVDWPAYCPPIDWHGKRVPDTLRSGNHAAIQKWREEKAAEKTVLHHFEWLRSHAIKQEDKVRAIHYIPPHYTALMHCDVNLPTGCPGTTSITSLDIHDIARSSHTYGIRNYFIVTPLKDQQKIVTKLLDFWQGSTGINYNEKRHKAVHIVRLVDSLNAVIKTIEEQEGKKPIVIATSARLIDFEKHITFYDQEKVWISGRPILFIFGTAQGLARSIIDSCDYMLLPIEGFTEYNHLSVRSAVAIILDRWLGINIKRYTENKI